MVFNINNQINFGYAALSEIYHKLEKERIEAHF